MVPIAHDKRQDAEDSFGRESQERGTELIFDAEQSRQVSEYGRDLLFDFLSRHIVDCEHLDLMKKSDTVI